jgi:hypothetical protein
MDIHLFYGRHKTPADTALSLAQDLSTNGTDEEDGVLLFSWVFNSSIFPLI